MSIAHPIARPIARGIARGLTQYKGVPEYLTFNAVLHRLLTGADGQPLTGADGQYLYGVA